MPAIYLKDHTMMTPVWLIYLEKMQHKEIISQLYAECRKKSRTN